MRLAGAALACMLSVGCADAEIVQAQAPRPLHDTLPPAPAVADAFSIYEQQEEMTRPPPRIRHSISLGNVGDEPLSGSVMRDTPIDPSTSSGYGQTWQQYIQNPSWPPSYRPPYAVMSPYSTYPYNPYADVPYPAPRSCSCAR